MKKILVVFFALLVTSFSFSQEKPEGKFSGYMFGDYYYFANSHNPALKDLNGFQLRRVYFTYDYKYNSNWAMRLRLEMATPDGFNNNAGKAVPFVKDAYISYKADNTKFILGISPTPTWEVIESTWGYRSVEKTPLDLQKFGSSRDFGLAVKGQFGNNGIFKYHAMFANGNGNKSEFNPGKKVLLSLGLYPTKEFIFEIYGDYSRIATDQNTYTLQGFAAYKTDKFRIGVQYAYQTREFPSASDLNLEIGSIFAAANVANNLNVFARADRNFDPNASGEKIAYLPFDKTAKSTFIVAGLDFSPVHNVHLMPNVEIITYDTDGGIVTPDTDVVPRLTFYFKF